MAVKVWSLTGDKTFQGLCPMEMLAESANDTTQCRICVIPIQQLIPPVIPPVDCGGTAVWEWNGQEFTLIEDNCTGTGVPIAPDYNGEGIGQQITNDCDC